MMKKVACAMLVLMLCGTAGATELGVLARLKTTPEEFMMLMKNSWATSGWVVFGSDHSSDTARFYDTLSQMQMSLNRGDIGEMILPDFVAEYLLKVSEGYSACCVSSSGKMSLCFGFLRGNDALRAKWNSALSYLRSKRVLADLEKKYVKDFPRDDSYDYIYGINTRKKEREARIEFAHYPEAETVRVAVTGDIPPVDFIDADGLPSGYSVAVLSEIGRFLKVNILPVNVSAGARTAALVSGRADVVFWYEVNRKAKVQPDVPDDVVLSEPYLDWEKFIHVTVGN